FQRSGEVPVGLSRTLETSAPDEAWLPRRLVKIRSRPTRTAPPPSRRSRTSSGRPAAPGFAALPQTQAGSALYEAVARASIGGLTAPSGGSAPSAGHRRPRARTSSAFRPLPSRACGNAQDRWRRAAVNRVRTLSAAAPAGGVPGLLAPPQEDQPSREQVGAGEPAVRA